MRRVVIIVALLWLAGPILRAEGAPIPITNFSFEDPALATVGAFTQGHINGWKPDTAFVGGVYRIANAPLANQVGWFLNTQIWQQTSAQLTNGSAYELTVAAGRDSGAVNFTYALYSGADPTTGTLLKTATVALPAPALSFQDFTLTFGPSDPTYATLVAGHAGENIVVVFAGDSPSASVDMDNVRLVEFVPEPTTLHLLGAGGFLLWRKRRSIR